MKLVVVTPHFEPDVAPTGAVITRIVHELAARGHRIDVLTSLPWYREHKVEPGFGGRLIRHEDTPWGRITRINPFAASDKQHFARRAAGFAASSAVTAASGLRGDRVDGVLAVSPPLTLGVAGWAIAARRGAPLVFNIQDVFPDVAVELGVLTNPALVSIGRWLERWCYARADAVTVLGPDLQRNVGEKVRDPGKVRVIPNFVDTEAIRPQSRDNYYREQFRLGDRTVVMYAGNVGLSQSLEVVIDAAGILADDPGIVFVINGQGAARRTIEQRARGLSNVVFVDMQPSERLPEVLAAGDIHLVPLKGGLADASVPSKTYSILAAGRPFIASVDKGSEIARMAEQSGAGVAVEPEDVESLTKSIRALSASPEEAVAMGEAGRRFIESWASPAAVAIAYEELFQELSG